VRYRAVIFDLWATLVPWDQEGANRFYDAMAQAAGVEETRFREAWLSGRKSREVGPIADHLRGLFGELGAEPDLSEVLQMRLEWTKRSLQPRPDAISTLESLREGGHRLGLITVCSEEVPSVWEETPFAGLFDATVFSCTEGISKPDPRIYEIACERLEVEPKDCLFVGDGANDELPGAERAGMTALQLRAPGEPLTPEGEHWTGASIERLSQVLDQTW
jgi:putative hydrolase of the HAD superfamily